ncbi:hypothetical protein ACTXT7_001313 [Hymenolepis weldensis]
MQPMAPYHVNYFQHGVRMKKDNGVLKGWKMWPEDLFPKWESNVDHRSVKIWKRRKFHMYKPDSPNIDRCSFRPKFQI